MTTATLSAARRQAPLRRAFADDPTKAISIKHVTSETGTHTDEWHGRIVAPDFPGTTWDYGIDAKVGGDDDLPNPGHLLCAALAACLESTTRIVADHLGIEIEDLTVDVVGDVDVRGCLALDRTVRPGFRRIDAEISLRTAPGTDDTLVELLLGQVDALCVTLDTIRHGVQVDLTSTVA
ncbi:OsmC family protein [Gordonia rhizosphera]|uniref:OsmC family protein n=1 Tax=Gordonia rhizosphera NBRC 16068 TaxID=1108045 RepID=K6V093_9ACTN|nr:OsmC family protein [Gordonia rhizosphera]GAB89238.1 hypothetical protein GORHZ_055_00210 [Gordonia rhizosphera NBRC 16068]